MVSSVVRRLVVPLVAAVLVLFALPREAPAPIPGPAAEAPLSEDPVAAAADAEQEQALLELWTDWGSDLMSTDSSEAPPVPAAVQDLPFEETVYVLASVRVAQLAAAERSRRVDGPAGSDDTALRPEPVAVTLGAWDSTSRCVSLDVTHEPYGRTFYGLVEPDDGLVEDAAGPAAGPTGALEKALQRTVRVGFRALHDATCGSGGAAFSPEASRALSSLSPELVEH